MNIFRARTKAQREFLEWAMDGFNDVMPELEEDDPRKRGYVMLSEDSTVLVTDDTYAEELEEAGEKYQLGAGIPESIGDVNYQARAGALRVVSAVLDSRKRL